MSEQLIAAIRMLEAGWSQPFSEQQAALYLDGLSDLPGEAVQAAVRRLVRVEEYRPSVAAVRRCVAADGAPDVQEALRQAEMLLRWREQRRFVNIERSAREPVVHVSVREICDGVRGRVFGWREVFVREWKQTYG